MAMSLNELRAAFETVIGRKTASKNKAWMRNRLAERGFAGGAPAAMVAEDAPAGSGQERSGAKRSTWAKGVVRVSGARRTMPDEGTW